MRSLIAGLAILLMSLPAAAAGFADYNGQELFMRFCASCHGADGMGEGPVADAVATTVPDLTRLARRNDGKLDEEKLSEIIDGRSVVIAHGTRFMPVWGYEFWVEEGADREAEAEVRQIIDRLIDYLRALQR
jgi:mono/diheme cytochrome c family protein